MTPLVVSIGTTHPRNAAGVGLDVRIAAQYGILHEWAIAAVSAQDEGGVRAVFPLPANVLQAQLDALALADAASVRVGALGNAENAAVAARALHGTNAVIIFDPVMRASAGGSLYAAGALESVRAFIDTAHPLVTPNRDEARELTGMAIESVGDLVAAGKELVARGSRGALVKGGHLPGDPVDVLVTENGVETFTDARLPQRTSGTGCTLAMALACELAQGRTLVDAVKGARAFVRSNIARA